MQGLRFLQFIQAGYLEGKLIHDPQFVVHCWMEPGWIRVGIHLHSPEKTQLNLFVDYGEGFSENTCIERLDYAGEVHTEFFFRLERPIFALRLDPRESEGIVRLEVFEACPVPAPQLFKRRSQETMRSFGEARRAGRPLLGLLAELGKGKLTPARPGAIVTIDYVGDGDQLASEHVKVKADGSFSGSLRPKRQRMKGER